MVARIEESVHDRAQRLVAAMVSEHPDGQCDFVSALAGPLPLQIICDIMGIPEEDEPMIFHCTTVMLGAGDEEVSGTFDDIVAATTTLAEYGVAMAERRREHPSDDLTTDLVQSDS